jgi:hypothetical protein
LGQRIIIRYSVEAPDLKHEVERLLTSALNRLSSIGTRSPATNNILTIRTAKEIELLREEIARIDIMLEDTSAIIGGFIEHEYNSFAKKTQGLASDMTNFEDIEQKISTLKHNIRHDSDIADQRSKT